MIMCCAARWSSHVKTTILERTKHINIYSRNLSADSLVWGSLMLAPIRVPAGDSYPTAKVLGSRLGGCPYAAQLEGTSIIGKGSARETIMNNDHYQSKVLARFSLVLRNCHHRRKRSI